MPPPEDPEGEAQSEDDQVARVKRAVPLRRLAPGHYLSPGFRIPFAGTWTLTVTVKPDRFTEQKATVEFPVD